MSPDTIPEEDGSLIVDADAERRPSIVSADGEMPNTPVTIVSPPSPESSSEGRKSERRELPTPPPE
jgi:hypothetical protein